MANNIWSATARTPRAQAGTASIKKGVHFIGLVNVMNLKAGGLGSLGNEQLEWMEDDVSILPRQHADCRVRAHSAVDRLSGMGLGH